MTNAHSYVENAFRIESSLRSNWQDRIIIRITQSKSTNTREGGNVRKQKMIKYRVQDSF
jgi:hypothetical protein